MNHPNVQHYVPQFLLRAFEAELGTEQVHVFDKETSRSFRTNVRNIAAEKGFNDFEFQGKTLTFEPALTALEDRMAVIVARIVDRGEIGFLSLVEREVVARFVLAQKLRTRQFFTSVHEGGLAMARALDDRHPGTAERLGFDPDPEESRLIAFRLLERSADWVPLILEKAWGLHEAANEHRFLIADHPVVMHNNVNQSDVSSTIGLGVQGIEIYLPISPQYCLGFMCQTLSQMTADAYTRSLRLKIDWGIELPAHERVGSLRDGLEFGFPIPSEPENVDYLNSLQVLHAERFVFSSNDRFELVEKMIARNPDVRHGPRVEVG